MGNVTAKTSGDIASFMTPAKTNITSLKIHFSPKQLGEGDPSPENVREIVGWDGVEVNGCGKNLWNNEDIIYGYWTDDNGKQSINQRGCRTQYIYVTSNTTIQLFYYGVQPYSASIIELDYNKEFIKRTHIAWKGVTNPKSLTITTSNETKYIYAQTYTYTSSSNSKMTYDILCSYKMQMEFNTITSYEPYQGNINTIDWSSEIGTVYGGYVDLISGELVEEYTYTEPNDNQWYVNTHYAYQLGHPDGVTITKTTYQKNICNYWKNNKWDNRYFITVNENGMLVIGKTVVEETFNGDYTAEGITEILANFKTNNLPLIVAYPLKTPITHQLTPTQLKLFVGQNNFWSNADYIEIEYELKETEDIQKARKKIILNQPHIESVNGDIVNFTTDMKAPLKECKVYFEPMQEGEGDPSPDNVRNITGWDGVDSHINGNKISVDWTNEVGTVYGGYVDLVKGELVAEYESISDTWGNWGTLYDQGDGTELRYKKFSNNIIGGSAGLNNSYCNIAKYNYNNSNGTIHFYIVSTSKNCRIYLPSGTDTSLQIQAVAKLTEPIHYQLTPQQLLTFKGTNNIWSNSNGQTEVKFWTH